MSYLTKENSMSAHRTARGKYRPILHVAICDGMTGEQLADVDAPSTADALAYYLRSRRIDESATEGSIVSDTFGPVADDSWRRAEITRQERHPISGVIEGSLWAKVTA